MTAPATLPTFTVGQELTSATMNNLKAQTDYLLGWSASRPLAVLHASAVQSLTSGSDAALLFDQEQLDWDAGHSTTSNTDRYTAQTSGVYMVVATCGFAANATGIRQLYISKSGTAQIGARTRVNAASSGGTVITAFAFPIMAVNDYVQAFAQQTSGGTINTDVSSLDVRPTLRVFLLAAT